MAECLEVEKVEASVELPKKASIAVNGLKVKTAPSNAFNCSHCKRVFTKKARNVLSDSKNVYCDRCAKEYRQRYDIPASNSSTPTLKTGRSIGNSRIGDRIGGNFLQELTALALCTRSCRVTVRNETSHVITSSGLVIFGHPDNQLDTMDISPNESQRYDYSMRFSLKGCAGIQKFIVNSDTSKLCFFVAFKNSTIQLKKDNRNKVALLLVTNDYINKDLDLRYFDKVMKNKKPCPTFDGCLQDRQYECTYRSSIASEENIFKMKCKDITIQVSMTHSRHCDIVVKVIDKKAVKSTCTLEVSYSRYSMKAIQS